MPARPYGSPTDLNLLKLALSEKEANEHTPGRVPSGIAENAYFNSIPNTQEQQREVDSYAALDAEANDRSAAQSQAVTMGYNSPHDMIEQTAEQKLQLAGEPARVAGKANVQAAESAGSAKLAAIQEMLGMGGDRSMSVSGVGSVGAPPKAPINRGPAASVLNSVKAAKGAMEAAEPGSLGKMFGRTNPKKAEYDQALANALQGFPPQARQDAQTLITKYGKKSPAELLDAARQEFPDLGPDEEDVLYNVLSLSTGQF